MKQRIADKDTAVVFFPIYRYQMVSLYEDKESGALWLSSWL